MKKILFISWDGAETNYMEGLFLPIFHAIQSKSDYQFHVIQFSWSDPYKISKIKETASTYQISYQHLPVYKKPTNLIGSVYSLFKGRKFVESYIINNAIDIVMPRSVMPAFLVNKLRIRGFKLVFDADGLPLEERIDFGGLNMNSRHYRFLKKQEDKILSHSDLVITRSKKSINIHAETIGGKSLEKFSRVINGRDVNFFKPNKEARKKIREELGVSSKDKVFVYCGSLGPQYCVEEMIEIFRQYYDKTKSGYFLVLTPNVNFIQERIPQELKRIIIAKQINYQDVPAYLSAADIAFSLRIPRYSMRGVFPIKLAEYLLMGLPTITSKGIGDTEDLLKDAPGCFIFNHFSRKSMILVADFVEKSETFDKNKIRDFAEKNFSIEKSAKQYIKTLDKLV